MSTWFQEEVAGDRYIFDSELNPVVLGCPQGEPVFVIPGEHAVEAERACVAHNAYYDAKLDEWRRRAEAAEYRIEHPPLAENQDDLARICFEAYMQYSSPESLVDKPWSDEDPWETYAWRLAANAVRVAVEAESLRVVPVVLEKGEEAKITAGTAVPHSLDEALPGDD